MTDENNPWRHTDTLRAAIEELRTQALSVKGEPVDEWYGRQLDAILEDHEP